MTEPARDDLACEIDEHSLSALCDPSLDPAFRRAERVGAESAWWGHVPFAHWLCRVVKPKLFVELGTHTGVSYSAFCESVVRERLETRCFAVDSWRGDEHAGFYGDQVLAELRVFHDARYAAFSTLVRSTFDEASHKFVGGSIDLLHIDGLHTYEAVKHDFETWRPKLSERAVVLFHDTNERGGDFGVWRFWRELQQVYPSFEFLHHWGLGVLAVGQDVPEPIRQLCSLSKPEPIATIRERFAFLGERWVIDWRERDMAARMADRESQVQTTAKKVTELETELGKANAELAEFKTTSSNLQKRVAREISLRQELEAVVRLEAERRTRAEQEAVHWKNLAADSQKNLEERSAVGGQFAKIQLEQRSLINDRNAMLASASWRVTAPLRWLSRAVRRLSGFPLGRGPRVNPELGAEAMLLLNSGLFDPEWYLRHYPDVLVSGIDPVVHYLQSGAAEGRNPGPGFDGAWYLSQYADVAENKINPLLHYVSNGLAEGRQIRPIAGL